MPAVGRGRTVRLITLFRGEQLDLEVELPAHVRVATRCRARSVVVDVDLAALLDQAATAAVRQPAGRAELLGGFVQAAVVG